jgi:hypothetical protein
MTASLPRRSFLKTAGGLAAGGALLGLGAESASASAPEAKPDIPIILPPIFFIFGTFDYVNWTELICPSGNVVWAGANTGAAHASSNELVGVLNIPDGATLSSVTAIAKGAGTINTTVFKHRLSSQDYDLSTAPTTATVISSTVKRSSPTIPSNYVVNKNEQIEVWIQGTSSGAVNVSAIEYSYFPVTTGFQAVTPTRVYDSRETGAGGPLASGATRDISVANAIAFNGAAAVANFIPSGAYCITYNITVVNTTAQGFLAMFPKGGTFKASSVNWFTANEIVGNGGVSTLGGDRQVTVQAGGGGSADFTIDVTGYYI